jgi:hypothetical protein
LVNSFSAGREVVWVAAVPGEEIRVRRVGVEAEVAAGEGGVVVRGKRGEDDLGRFADVGWQVYREMVCDAGDPGFEFGVRQIVHDVVDEPVDVERGVHGVQLCGGGPHPGVVECCLLQRDLTHGRSLSRPAARKAVADWPTPLRGHEVRAIAP